MSTELTTIALQDQALADVGLSRAQARVLADTICKDATQNELVLFANVCRSKGMDPFSGQIFMVKRDGKVTFQTGIDGFRSQAEASGSYAGNDEPVFEYGGDKKPTKASVTVWKMVEGVRVPFTASARWDEFCPSGKMDFIWKAKPHVMLGKCAEAQALRRAFPKQLARALHQGRNGARGAAHRDSRPGGGPA